MVGKGLEMGFPMRVDRPVTLVAAADPGDQPADGLRIARGHRVVDGGQPLLCTAADYPPAGKYRRLLSLHRRGGGESLEMLAFSAAGQ